MPRGTAQPDAAVALLPAAVAAPSAATVAKQAQPTFKPSGTGK